MTSSRPDWCCTIVARNYIAQARVLARSFTALHPGARFTTLVIDGSEDDRGLVGLGEVLLPKDLGLATSTVHRMQTIYDVMEYATALKPALLMRLLRLGARSATYFDPDIRLYGEVGDVFDAAAESGLVLTPHTVEPLPRDGRWLNEAVIMHAGIYNLGFVASGPNGYPFLAWWHSRLTTDAVVDLPNALFTDQRWVDWAPALAEPTVLRDRGLNAAYWNLHERPVHRAADGSWSVGGTPLRFFHFSGYDPATPWILSKHQGQQPRNLFSEQPGLRQLCDAYGAELVAAGHVELRRQAYRLSTLADGLRLTPLVRRVYRDALVSDDRNLAEPPDPWADAVTFRSWLLSHALRAGPIRFSRLEYALWRARQDLRSTFPDPLGIDAPAFRGWLDGAPDLSNELCQMNLRPPRPRRSARRGPVQHRFSAHGWSVIGYATAELGVGEAGRRLSSAVNHTGVPWEMVGVTTGPLSRQEHDFRGRLTASPGYQNSILCVNADQTARMSSMLGLDRGPGRRVGYWFWELETFPQRFHHAFTAVDEVWVASEFNRDAIAATTDKPVRVVPLPVHVPARQTAFLRQHLGIPVDKIVFLVNFDYLSVIERKNPLGAIEAYRRAFGPDEGACLVVKSINGHHRPLDRERVRMAAAGRPDILMKEEYLTAIQMQALVELVDCMVSLHRAEGYGLNLVDAMSRSTPVVATGYSGNMSFMDGDSALLVPFATREVGPHAAPYDPDSFWAEPDLDEAAGMLRRVLDDPGGVASITEAALARMRRLSAAHVATELAPLLLPPVTTIVQDPDDHDEDGR